MKCMQLKLSKDEMDKKLQIYFSFKNSIGGNIDVFESQNKNLNHG